MGKDFRIFFRLTRQEGLKAVIREGTLCQGTVRHFVGDIKYVVQATYGCPHYYWVAQFPICRYNNGTFTGTTVSDVSLPIASSSSNTSFLQPILSGTIEVGHVVIDVPHLCTFTTPPGVYLPKGTNRFSLHRPAMSHYVNSTIV